MLLVLAVCGAGSSRSDHLLGQTPAGLNVRSRSAARGTDRYRPSVIGTAVPVARTASASRRIASRTFVSQRRGAPLYSAPPRQLSQETCQGTTQSERLAAEAPSRRTRARTSARAEPLPAGRNPGGPRLRRDHRCERRVDPRTGKRQPRGAHRRDRAHLGRNRHRQGTHRARDPARPAGARRRFIKLDCAALRTTATEAFAARCRPSRSPHGGTIFLDEIGELNSNRRPSCCACCSSRNPIASARASTAESTCASSPPPTAICARPYATCAVPRRPLLPPECVSGRAAAAARARRGHPAAGAVLRAEVRAARRPPRRRRRSGYARRAHPLSVARQHSRARKPGRARADPEHLADAQDPAGNAGAVHDGRARRHGRGGDRHAPPAAFSPRRRSISTTPKTPGCTTCSASTSCACSMPRIGSSRAIPAPRSSSA